MLRVFGLAILTAAALGCGSIAEDESDGTADGTVDVSGEVPSDADGDGVEDIGADGIDADTPPDADDGVSDTVADDGVGDTTVDDGITVETGEAGETTVAVCGNGEVETGEECDDGNDIAGDGCEGDCAFSCHRATDCADGNSCTDDVCGAETHACSNPPLDISCDDGDSCTVGDWCERGDCVPEATLPWGFPDRDGDGFGDGSIEATCGAGFVPDGTDCCDSALAVHPEQIDWFTTPSICGADGTSSWDYNCSRTIETQYPTSCARCERSSGGGCTPVAGWERDPTGEACTPPACGVGAHWLSGFACVLDGASGDCLMNGTPGMMYRVQGCH